MGHGMTEDRIHRHFATAASTYDLHAQVQRSVAGDLLRYCPEAASDILELGCGTGAYTRLLASRFPSARITAVDFSEEMLAVARASADLDRVRFVQADLREVDFGSLPGDEDRGGLDFNNRFDLITSNAALQWTPDLDSIVERLRRRMAKGGTFAFSYFGAGTYCELRGSLVNVVGHDVRLPSSGFAGATELANLLKRHFASAHVDALEYRETFPSLRDLLSNIRATGTRGDGIQPPVAWTRGLLRRVEERYLAEFGGISATYEVLFCVASQTP